MKESVLNFEEKTTQLWCIYFQITDSIFDDFGICLLGYRTEFSCLYLPQGHNFTSTVWLKSTDEYVFFLL